jgi:hypothetical protein
MIKGFLIDDEKLKGTKSSYFDELYDRVKSIRISEKNFWQKIKDIFAFGSIDFESITFYFFNSLALSCAWNRETGCRPFWS